VADGAKRGCKRTAQAWQFGGPKGPASWPEITAQHGWPSAIGGRDPGDRLQRGFGFTPGGPEPATHLGYCDRVPIMLRQPYTQQQQQPGDTLPLSTSINLKDLILALPTATPPQKQRLVQQAIELKELYQYHCQSMQIFSANYQALVGMANGAAMLSATMLALLSLHGLQTDIRWPFSVLVASGFALGIAVVTINTFNLKSNQQMSARLY